MKRLAIFLAVTLLAILLPAPALAQARRGGARTGGRGGMRGGGAAMDEHTTIIVLSALLDLDDAQQKKLKTILDAAIQIAAPLATQIDGANGALFDAVKSGQSDDEVETLASRAGSVTTQMLTLEAQTFSKVMGILTKDQKSQVDATMYADVAEFLSSAQPPTTPPSAASPPTPPQ
jgi:LTXXQ motif family protein